jgi:phage shock protein PspC (stress-responsive transcriptional regulator)
MRKLGVQVVIAKVCDGISKRYQKNLKVSTAAVRLLFLKLAFVLSQ